MSILTNKDEVFDILHYLDVNFANSFDWHTLNEVRKLVEKLPSADIVECARTIKEYCEKYDEHCVGCPFNSAKPTKWCELGCSSLPCDWDLPKGEKE